MIRNPFIHRDSSLRELARTATDVLTFVLTSISPSPSHHHGFPLATSQKQILDSVFRRCFRPPS